MRNKNKTSCLLVSYDLNCKLSKQLKLNAKKILNLHLKLNDYRSEIS